MEKTKCKSHIKHRVYIVTRYTASSDENTINAVLDICHKGETGQEKG